METRVVHIDLISSEIKPQDLLARYFKKVAEDCEKFFPASARKKVPCPGCGSNEVRESFSKFGMQYIVCGGCYSYYVGERPAQAAIDSFYRESRAREFWLADLWTKTLEQRRGKILEPFLEWMASYLSDSATVIELYPHQWGLTELSKPWNWKVVEPQFPTKLCPVKNLNAMMVSAKDAGQADAVCLMDTIGRAADPKALLSEVHKMLKPGGMCFMSSLLSSGLELMVLKDTSDTVFPPDRLNVLSYEGINRLIEAAGFETVEFSTPGVLDMQIIREAIEKKHAAVPQFFNYILETRKDEELVTAFQDFLQTYRLSSQARIVLRKIR